MRGQNNLRRKTKEKAKGNQENHPPASEENATETNENNEVEIEDNQNNQTEGVKERKERKRDSTRQYTFSLRGQTLTVCAYFFLKTLDIDEKRVRNALKSTTDVGTYSEAKTGKHNNQKKVDDREKSVIEHISKFKTVESHYVRKSAKCQYLPKELTVREMHRMYVEDHDGLDKVENYNFYLRVFTTRFNLKFHKNKKDKCNSCESFKNTPEDIRTEEQIDKNDKHLDEKENARLYKARMKEEGKKSNVIAAAFDLEKVLLCPHGQTSSFYYSKRLKVHNFTITDIASMVTHCFVWHEGEAQKGSSEIATCLQTYTRWVKSQDVDILSLFSDRCGGQNSNRMVVIALHEAFLKHGFQRLEMNFLVTGHSQNENDTAHSLIESKTRMRTLYTPTEWRTAIQMSFKLGSSHVHPIQTGQVIDFKDKCSYPEYTAVLSDSTTENDELFKNKKDGKVYWSQIMQYYFDKSDPDKMFFKYDYSAPSFKFTTIHKKVPTRKTSGEAVFKKRAHLYQAPPGIEKDKKIALLKLCNENLIPEVNWPFFQDLTVQNSVVESESDES